MLKNIFKKVAKKIWEISIPTVRIFSRIKKLKQLMLQRYVARLKEPGA